VRENGKCEAEEIWVQGKTVVKKKFEVSDIDGR
jgi:hypothetical protein